MSLRIVPVTFAAACEFIAAWHRHHAPPIGHKFSIGIADDGGILRGVVVVGRPVVTPPADLGQGPDACPSCGQPDVVRPDLSIKSHDVLGLASLCDAPPSLLPEPARPVVAPYGTHGHDHADDIGWPPAGHEPPTAAEWYEPQGATP